MPNFCESPGLGHAPPSQTQHLRASHDVVWVHKTLRAATRSDENRPLARFRYSYGVYRCHVSKSPDCKAYSKKCLISADLLLFRPSRNNCCYIAGNVPVSVNMQVFIFAPSRMVQFGHRAPVSLSSPLQLGKRINIYSKPGTGRQSSPFAR